MKTPSLDMMIGVGPHHHPGKSDPPEMEDKGPDEDVLQACEEFFDAAGLKIAPDKRDAAAEALHSLIDIAIEKHGGSSDDSSGELSPDDGEE